MEKPDTATVAYFDRNLPADPRVVRGQMFGCPCGFVNGHMFFGTFTRSVVVRVGAERAATAVKGAVRHFEPIAGRPWKDYLQIETDAVPDGDIRALAAEALEMTARLAPKPPAGKRDASGAPRTRKKKR